MKEVFKIIKKHFNSSRYSGDVFILYYKFSILRYWKEFPIYFTDEKYLKDFLEMSYIFDNRFYDFEPSYLSYCITCKNYRIKIYDLVHIQDHYIFNNTSSYGIIEEVDEDTQRFYGKTLAIAFKKYLEGEHFGISEPLEEKIYKLVEE